MNERTLRRLLRTLAIAIAIAGVIDPAVTSNRRVKPTIVVTATDSALDGKLADRVSNILKKTFVVSRAPIAGASGSVVVGDAVSREDDFSAPLFVVKPDSAAPRVRIDRVAVPSVASTSSRMSVRVALHVQQGAGRALEVTLRAGSIVVDQVHRSLGPADSGLVVPLTFVPTHIGAAPLRISATLAGADEPAVADAVVDVRDRRWTVLFFDPRPSWSSRFVRRAIENDPRFTVASRVITSKNVSTDVGQPPATLADAQRLSQFDAIVVGAPDALSTAEVGALDAYMRRRGGSVVLVLDDRTPGAWDRLTGVSAWSMATSSPIMFSDARGDSLSFRASSVAYPTTVPAGATVIAGGNRPVVWTSAFGAGRLVVSGALDAWRFRDPSISGFDRFWRSELARAADASPAEASVALSASVAAPGEAVDVDASIRDLALQPMMTNVRASHASIAAAIMNEDQSRTSGSRPVHLWPTPDVGSFSGRVLAPRAPGIYRILITSAGATASAPLVVVNDVRRPSETTTPVLAAWANAHGGRVVGAADVDRLPAIVGASVNAPVRAETWHPMRSGWWIFPFLFLLSGEWWLRRRQGRR